MPTDPRLSIAEIEEALKVCEHQERREKHWAGPTREHHEGCGYGKSICPGFPDWQFARTLLPRALDELKQLRKVAAHVPGLVYIKAKEEAGFADAVHPAENVGGGNA